MVNVDTKALTSSLDAAIARIKQKLEAMVIGFAYEFTMAAALNTPIGDPLAYPRFYASRRQAYGIAESPGFHKGAWEANTDNSFNFSPSIRQPSVKELVNYKLGSNVYIGASGPAFYALENGYSRQTPSISQPTLADVQSAYLVDVKRYYDAG